MKNKKDKSLNGGSLQGDGSVVRSSDVPTICFAPRLLERGTWKAWLSIDSRYWGCGRTHTEAIGSLVMSFPKLFALNFQEMEHDSASGTRTSDLNPASQPNSNKKES